MRRTGYTYGKNSTLLAGKYKGETIGSLMERDPNYILWLSEQKVISIEPSIVKYALTHRTYRMRFDTTKGDESNERELDEVYGFGCGSFGVSD